MKLYIVLFVLIFGVVLFDAKKSINKNKSSNKSAKKKNVVKPVKEANENATDYDIVDDTNEDNKSSSTPEFLKNTFDLTKKLAKNIAKSGKSVAKATVDLCVVKHITIDEIYGKWLIRQEVEVRPGIFISCPATLVFKEKDGDNAYDNTGIVSTVFEGQTHSFKFTFTEKKWPMKCKIRFEAKAFQESDGSEPIRMLYKGYFKGSLTNSRVLLLRGKIYRLSGKMWKKQTKCGTFKAIKRRYD